MLPCLHTFHSPCVDQVALPSYSKSPLNPSTIKTIRLKIPSQPLKSPPIPNSNPPHPPQWLGLSHECPLCRSSVVNASNDHLAASLAGAGVGSEPLPHFSYTQHPHP